jgi:hypothetical protein
VISGRHTGAYRDRGAFHEGPASPFVAQLIAQEHLPEIDPRGHAIAQRWVGVYQSAVEEHMAYLGSLEPIDVPV